MLVDAFKGGVYLRRPRGHRNNFIGGYVKGGFRRRGCDFSSHLHQPSVLSATWITVPRNWLFRIFSFSFFPSSFFFSLSPSVPISPGLTANGDASSRTNLLLWLTTGHKICCGTGNVLRGGSVLILDGELIKRN